MGVCSLKHKAKPQKDQMGRGSVIWSLYFSDWAWPAMPPPKNTSIIVKPSHRRRINQRPTQLQTCFCNHFTAGLQKHCTSFSCGNNKQLLHFHFVQPSLEKSQLSSIFLQVYCEVLVAALASEAKKSNLGPILQYYHLLHCQRLWILVFIQKF